MRIYVTDFALGRHFKGGSGTQINMTGEEFTQKVNSLLDSKEATIKPGAFEFSKIIVLENFAQASAGAVRIGPQNKEFLVSEYTTRREGELPYLSRFLKMPPNHKAPIADHLVVIVYERSQLEDENKEFAKGEEIKADYGVVSIQANMIPDAEPMTPMTMYRNALGKKYGGNGEPIDEKALFDAAQYWEYHATIQTQ